MSGFTIKDLENLSGIKAHTIRMWEQRYNFLKPQRTDTNIRYYSNEELKTLLNIALLNKYGFKLCHIDQMQPEDICEKILSLKDEQAVQERIVNDLVRRMIDFDTAKFETILDRCIRETGIERTLQEIVFSFLEKIGILWQTNHIMPAQEHLVSGIIRQKLIVAIDAVTPVRTGTKKVVLFLPEGEHHELGLLFLHYLLKRQGVKVIYLGASVPLSDVEVVVRELDPDLVFIHLTSPCRSGFSFEKLVQSFPANLCDLPVVISGYPAHRCCHHDLPSRLCFKKSLFEITDFISTL